jgi:starvation-inducible DNA-binding protein
LASIRGSGDIFLVEKEEHPMYRSPSQLPETARRHVADALNAALADGLDLHGQLKVAHWNVKGALFASLHPLFETIASAVSEHNDEIAERAVTLGAIALGTARHVAATSRLPDYPQDTARDLDHVRRLAERLERYLVGLRAARSTADEHGDGDTADLVTAITTEVEKHGWFLRATLGE